MENWKKSWKVMEFEKLLRVQTLTDLQFRVQVGVRLRIFTYEHAHLGKFQPPDTLRVLSTENSYLTCPCSFSDLKVGVQRKLSGEAKVQNLPLCDCHNENSLVVFDDSI